MKDAFYKTIHEQLLAGVVDRYYNDDIGGRENHYYDTGELLPITEEELVKNIVAEILSCKTVLWTERGFGLEAKHIRFMGKERVTEIVKYRVNQRHTKDGCWEWEVNS